MKRIRAILHGWLVDHAHALVGLFYGDFWGLRTAAQRHHAGFAGRLYFAYLESLSSWIGLQTVLDSATCFPHGIRSVFISDYARIGAGCVIYQQVTIGSVFGGAPMIGKNVVIGAGAVIIGKCSVGDGARIGAGAVVAKDVPAGATCVSGPMRMILRGGK